MEKKYFSLLASTERSRGCPTLLHPSPQRLNAGRLFITGTTISGSFADLTTSTRPVDDKNRGRRGRRRREAVPPTASFRLRGLQVSGGGDRRGGHAPAGEAKLNPVSLNASEMTRPLHFCADLFILLLFIHFAEASSTFPGCRGRPPPANSLRLGKLVNTEAAASCCISGLNLSQRPSSNCLCASWVDTKGRGRVLRLPGPAPTLLSAALTFSKSAKVTCFVFWHMRKSYRRE